MSCEPNLLVQAMWLVPALCACAASVVGLVYLFGGLGWWRGAEEADEEE